MQLGVASTSCQLMLLTDPAAAGGVEDEPIIIKWLLVQTYWNVPNRIKLTVKPFDS